MGNEMTNDAMPNPRCSMLRDPGLDYSVIERSGRWSFIASMSHWSLAIATSLCMLGTATALEPASLGAASSSRFGNLPLYFEANRGQADEHIQFFARGQNHTIYLSRDGATIALREGSAGAIDSSSAKVSTRSKPLKGTNISSVRFVQMTLVGANPTPSFAGQQELAGRVNYMLGNNPANWQRAVPTFAKVQYDRVYPGVDLVYYGKEQELEYDFAVAPQADPSAIQLHFEGADRLQIDARGDLILHVGSSELRQHKPVVYQIIAGKRHEVRARYQIQDSKTVFFALGKYDRWHTLVIDPVLSYSTYLGGSKGDVGWAIAVDAGGSAHVAGETLSVLKKLPTSGEQLEPGGGTKYGGDAFVARLDFDETNQSLTLGYLTYFGGDGLDAAIGIAVDGAGSAYITGYTTSTNFPVFPVPGVVQPNIAGSIVLDEEDGKVYGSFNSHYTDAFVTKLDTNGFGVYSTYLGGDFSETGSDIAVDTTGCAYVVGYSDSALIYVSTNWVQTTRCTNSVCGPITHYTNTTYVRLLVANALATNTVINVKSGTTNTIDTITETTLIGSVQIATNFPVISAVQTNNGGFSNILSADLFVAKLSADASALIFSTYLGGVDEDFGSGIGVAPDGSVSVSGWTESVDFPVTNAFQGEFAGGVETIVRRRRDSGASIPQSRDAVVAKLTPTGDSLVFSTYLGGSRNDDARRLAVDAAGATYVTGTTGSPDFPSTPGALNQGGVFTSTNTTATWSLSSSGLSHTVVDALIADPFNPGTLYSGTPRGVFKSIDNGASWTGLSTGLVNRTVNTLAIEPLTGSPVYAGTVAGLFQSTDGGLSWTNAETQLGSPNVRAILFDSVTGTNLFLGTSSGVYARTNDTNWSMRNMGLRSRSVRALVDDPASILYAGTDGGVYRSTNEGVNWTKMNKGLKTTKVSALVIDPADASTLYAGTTKGIYKSMDAGTNWAILTNGIGRPTINSILIDPTLSSLLYAGTANGLFRSSDAGASWSLSQSNLSTRDVSALVFAPGSTDTIYAGTRGTNFAGGTNDAFLVKFAPDGLALEYALTFGGNRNDEGWDVAVDADGNAYVIGETASRNFPVTPSANSSETNLWGKIDAFVTKFDTNGATKLFSMYFGGNKRDFGYGIDLDPAGNTYIVGRTDSTKLPTTNSLQTINADPLKFGGKRDAFVAKLMTAPPVLTVQPIFSSSSSGLPGFNPSQLLVSWPAPAFEFTLEAREPESTEWIPVTAPVKVVNGRHQVILPASDTTLLFRLRM